MSPSDHWHSASSSRGILIHVRVESLRFAPVYFHVADTTNRAVSAQMTLLRVSELVYVGFLLVTRKMQDVLATL